MAPADPWTTAGQPGLPVGSSPQRPGDPSSAEPPTGQTGGTPPASGWQPVEGGPPPPPTVSLPKGGGAIRDIGEKFSVSAATGTATLTVPIATSPGRARFGPSLALSYDSGIGNG